MLLGLPTSIPLRLAPFENNPFLDEISFGFETRTLKLFGPFPFGGILPSAPFPFMMRLLVKELVILLEPELFTSSHI